MDVIHGLTTHLLKGTWLFPVFAVKEKAAVDIRAHVFL